MKLTNTPSPSVFVCASILEYVCKGSNQNENSHTTLWWKGANACLVGPARMALSNTMNQSTLPAPASKSVAKDLINAFCFPVFLWQKTGRTCNLMSHRLWSPAPMSVRPPFWSLALVLQLLLGRESSHGELQGGLESRELQCAGGGLRELAQDERKWKTAGHDWGQAKESPSRRHIRAGKWTTWPPWPQCAGEEGQEVEKARNMLACKRSVKAGYSKNNTTRFFITRTWRHSTVIDRTEEQISKTESTVLKKILWT